MDRIVTPEIKPPSGIWPLDFFFNFILKLLWIPRKLKKMYREILWAFQTSCNGNNLHTRVQYHKQEIDIDIIHRTHLDIHSFTISLSEYIYSSIQFDPMRIFMESYHYQVTALFHHQGSLLLPFIATLTLSTFYFLTSGNH